MKMLTDKIRMHIRENLLSYIILVILFFGGVVLGGYITHTYNTDSIGAISDFFNDVFEKYTTIYVLGLFS